MFCIVALLIFSILGIFSATHRQWAKEALDCVLRRVTFRPCNTGFREKIKSKILIALIDRSPFAAKFFNRHFELLAWLFMILMIGSTVWSIRGGYNYYLYGSCNGLNETGFCAFDPSGSNNKVSTVSSDATCAAVATTEKDLTLQYTNLSIFPTINNNSKDKIVMVACYACEYSRKAYPELESLVAKYKTDFTFLHFPVKEGEENIAMSANGLCAYRQDAEKFWALNRLFFQIPLDKESDQAYLNGLATQVGLDIEVLNKCVSDPETIKMVKEQYHQIRQTKFYGTPTVFINGQALVGPKPYRVYRAALRKYILF